jgi:uncharacterized protein YecE (DUF72 family)
MQLHVGQSSLRGDIARYAERFNLLELRAEPGKLPRASRLRKWLADVPEGFVFSVVLPQRVNELDPSADVRALLEQALGTAEVLRASWIVVQTPASVTPTTRSRERLARLVDQLRRAERRIAWEPRGVWQDEEAERVSSALGVHLVRDVSRSPAPPGDVVYSRMRGLGDASRVRVSAVERVADRLAGCSESYVVIEGEGAVRGAQLLRQLAQGVREDFADGIGLGGSAGEADDLETGDETADDELATDDWEGGMASEHDEEDDAADSDAEDRDR